MSPRSLSVSALQLVNHRNREGFPLDKRLDVIVYPLITQSISEAFLGREILHERVIAYEITDDDCYLPIRRRTETFQDGWKRIRCV